MGEFGFPLGWVPALPLIGAAILGVMRGLFRRDLSHRWTALVPFVAVLASLGFLLAAFFELLMSAPGGAIVVRAGTWMGAGIAPNATMIDFAFRLDPLSSVIGLLVAAGGLFAVVHAVATLPADQREDRGLSDFSASHALHWPRCCFWFLQMICSFFGPPGVSWVWPRGGCWAFGMPTKLKPMPSRLLLS